MCVFVSQECDDRISPCSNCVHVSHILRTYHKTWVGVCQLEKVRHGDAGASREGGYCDGGDTAAKDCGQYNVVNDIRLRCCFGHRSESVRVMVRDVGQKDFDYGSVWIDYNDSESETSTCCGRPRDLVSRSICPVSAYAPASIVSFPLSPISSASCLSSA